jgi:vacuolar protein sorting-associated protein 35
VDGVLELCHVLIRDQTDNSSASRAAAAAGAGLNGQSTGGVNTANASIRKHGPHFVEREEMAEEQGWVARMVHLFRAESLDVQFEVGFFL